MRALIILTICIAMAVTAGSCKFTRSEIDPADFLKIEDEVSLTDLSPEAKEKVAKKYGYTLEQYKSFEERARTDKKLQEELGAIRLKAKQ